MFCVGITGGIGTGKTTVAKIFSSFGISIYNADEEAKNIVNTNRELRKKIIYLLGEESYKKEKYNTVFVAEKVFFNKALLAQLNNIIHPAVFKHFEEWKNSHQSNSPYIIKEASILFESQSYKDLDFIIGISSPQKTRIQRLKKYRKLSNSQIEERMKNQINEEEKLKRCDAVIYNQPDLLIVPQVWQWHNNILKKI